MVSDWGGMTFLIPYVLFVILIGSTGLIEEMALGRAAKGCPIKAFGKCTEVHTGKKKSGEIVGLLPVIGSLACVHLSTLSKSLNRTALSSTSQSHLFNKSS